MNETVKPKVMFYVQHLLGIGHVFRAVRVAQALARAGCETHVVWGGTKIESLNTDGLQMTYLEAVRVQNEDFKTLLKIDGTPISEEGKQQRGRNLLGLFHRVKPDIVITEAYPFGRRQMRFELLPLLEAVKNADWHPMMVSSIRDIMQENRVEKRVRESIDLIKNWFDLVMVHGDEALISVGETLQNTDEIADKIVHTGLVTPEPVNLDIAPSVSPDVLVSAGGGAVGLGLMKVAIKAMNHCEKFPTNWLLVTGPDLPQTEFDQLLKDVPTGMDVIRFIPDLARVMAAAKVSVSRAGYNTVGDILRAGTSAVLVPFAGGIETEQLRRAQMMDERGVATLLLEEELSPESLAKSIDAAAAKPVAAIDLDLNGADNAAKMLINTHQNHMAK
ncbi:MAG: glycosyl transferase [Hyphomicrobiales bacterium]|nr:MAG: glycosyl transferase [Hyphomicrobiales bacterium]